MCHRLLLLRPQVDAAVQSAQLDRRFPPLADLPDETVFCTFGHRDWQFRTDTPVGSSCVELPGKIRGKGHMDRAVGGLGRQGGIAITNPDGYAPVGR